MHSIDSDTVMHRNMQDVVVTENGHFDEDFIFNQQNEQRVLTVDSTSVFARFKTVLRHNNSHI